MEKKFTASEVRDEIAGMQCAIDNAGFGSEGRVAFASYAMDNIGKWKRVLNAFADLLEAQERTVPVVWVSPDDLANPYFVGIGAAKEAHQDLGKHYTLPLYTHPVPSDAKRLAEALLNYIEPYLDTGDSRTAQDWAVGIYKILAAHSAQAQLPAASATPNLASYWRIVAEAAEVLQMVLDSGVKLPPNWRWPLLDELSGLSAMMLAAQENK